MPARVYVTVSMSGLMCSPCISMSSPTLTIAVMSSAGATRTSPESIRAAPTPPHRATSTPRAYEGRHSLPSGAPLVPSPPAMAARIPVDQHPTVVSALRAAARLNADLEAYVEPGEGGGRRAITFAEWDRAADGVAGYLAERGVAKGDVVCVLLPSSIDYAVLYAAALRLGAITSGINPRMGAPEVTSIVERAAPVLVVCDPASPPPPTIEVAVVERAEV